MDVADLDVVHHKWIVTLMILVALVTGILFGVRIGSAAGSEGLLVILFALSFLLVMLVLLVFMRLIHVSDDVKELRKEHGRMSKVRGRKGQAAMEFLATYGWAIMILLVMIGALAYFGVLNPQKYIPERCIFKVGFGCTDFVVNQDTATDPDSLVIRFNLLNSMGETIQIQAVNISLKSAASTACLPQAATVRADENVSFRCATSFVSPGVGQPVKFKVDMIYKPLMGAYSRPAQGEMNMLVQ